SDLHRRQAGLEIAAVQMIDDGAQPGVHRPLVGLVMRRAHVRLAQHLHADGVVAAAQLLAQLLVACDRFRGRGIVSRLGSGGGATGAEEERHGHGQEGNSRTHASPGFLLLGASITKSAPGCRERLRRRAESYQRMPPPRPPRAGGLSVAMFTRSARPPRSLPFSSSACSADCCFAKVMKAKPFGRPVSLSLIIASSSMSP